jgi:hypothetical protein
MVGRAHEAAAAQEAEEEVISPRKKSKARKAAEVEEEEYPAEYDEVVPLADEPSTSSPKKRKAMNQPDGDQGTPRSASILKVRLFLKSRTFLLAPRN